MARASRNSVAQPHYVPLPQGLVERVEATAHGSAALVVTVFARRSLPTTGVGSTCQSCRVKKAVLQARSIFSSGVTLRNPQPAERDPSEDLPQR